MILSQSYSGVGHVSHTALVVSPPRFQALYNYLPRNEDELELKEGDIVDVMEKCDDGWFVGKREE